MAVFYGTIFRVGIHCISQGPPNQYSIYFIHPLCLAGFGITDLLFFHSLSKFFNTSNSASSCSSISTCCNLRLSLGDRFTSTAALQPGGALSTTCSMWPGGAFVSSCCGVPFTGDLLPSWTSLHLGVALSSYLPVEESFPVSLHFLAHAIVRSAGPASLPFFFGGVK